MGTEKRVCSQKLFSKNFSAARFATRTEQGKGFWVTNFFSVTSKVGFFSIAGTDVPQLLTVLQWAPLFYNLPCSTLLPKQWLSSLLHFVVCYLFSILLLALWPLSFQNTPKEVTKHLLLPFCLQICGCPKKWKLFSADIISVLTKLSIFACSQNW